jgi:hypothetical protein
VWRTLNLIWVIPAEGTRRCLYLFNVPPVPCALSAAHLAFWLCLISPCACFQEVQHGF